MLSRRKSGLSTSFNDFRFFGASSEMTHLYPILLRYLMVRIKLRIVLKRFTSDQISNCIERDAIHPLKQLCSKTTISAFMDYIAKGAAFSFPIQFLFEKLLIPANFTEFLTSSFPTLFARTLDMRRQMELKDDEEDQSKVAAKWFSLYKSAAEPYFFTIEAWLECGSDEQMAAAARTVLFLSEDKTYHPLGTGF